MFPPTKKKPMMPAKKTPMGMSSPPPIGGPPEPDADDMGGAPDNDADDKGVKPEALMYHDDLHTCESCQYMGGDGNCSILKMQVNPQGGCNAFEAKGGGEGTGDTGMSDMSQVPAPYPS